MFLVIAEKPSVSQALAKALSAGEREDGYLAGKDCIVSWCLGHLAEYASPDYYDSRYGKWEFADLPIVPGQWELAVAKDKKKQFAVLKKLLNRSNPGRVCQSERWGGIQEPLRSLHMQGKSGLADRNERNQGIYHKIL